MANWAASADVIAMLSRAPQAMAMNPPTSPAPATATNGSAARVIRNRPLTASGNVDNDATIANLAVRFGDAWVTPPVDSGLLPGTRRAAMVAAGELVERVVTIDELRASDEIALVSSARGWRSAVIVP